MLTLLTGSDRVRLTQEVFLKIREAADAGVTGQVLIVPEQFSHEAERRLCQIGGPTISRYAEVLSFSRLSDRLSAIYGGAARLYLDKGGQFLSMALAAEQIASRIKHYAAVIRRPEFLNELLRVIGEFRSYCIPPEMVLHASQKVEGMFSEKLHELGLLYEAYLAVCENVAADPSDKLMRLRDMLADHEWAENRLVYVDGFSDFTGSERAVLELLILACKHVTVTVPGGPSSTTLGRLSDDQRLLLRQMAAQVECPCNESIIGNSPSRSWEIQYFLDYLFSSGAHEPLPGDHVTLTAYSSVEDECKGVVRRIKELLMGGAKCGEISVAYTDRTAYEAPLRSVFRSVDLPVYFAGETDILSSPVVGSVLNSLAAAVGSMDYEDVALYLKSDLPQVDRDCCDRLDNYSYLWNLKGSQWEKPWVLHPRGFGEIWTDEDRVVLERLNRDKDVVLEPLLSLRKNLFSAKKTEDMVEAFHQFLEQVSLRKRLEEKANMHAASGNRQLAQELLQVYEILISALEQTWVTLGKTQRSPDDFFKLYQMLLTRYQIGTIPAGLDQIHISDLPDLRHRQTKHLLILGASDGKMPAYKAADGLLTEEERRLLTEHGLSMAPSRADQMELEIIKIYHALCAGEQSLWMSYAGEQPCWIFRHGCELVSRGEQKGELDASLDLYSFAAKKLRYGDAAEFDVPNLKEVEADLCALKDYNFSSLEERTVKGLYGSPISLSPSKLDQYAACRFEYFMQYGLKAKPRKQAKLDQPAFGTFVHAVLEHTVLRVKEAGGFHVVEKEQLLEIALDEIASYAKEHFPEQDERDLYLFQRSQKEILEIVEDLWEELRNSLFVPEYCELKFAENSLLPTIVIQGEKTDCKITGTIDRVDLYEHKDKTYVRVVDYKTGSKDFDFTDILNGAGMQMLIYLFALREFGGTYLQRGELEPAGVLYLPAKKEYPLTGPMPKDGEVEQEHQNLRKRKGLIRSDEHLLAAMEADPEQPKFMPYKNGRNGISGNLADKRQMVLLERHILRSVEKMADQIAAGEVAPNPVVRGQHTPCRYCDYRSVCHKDMGTQSPRVLAETSAKLFWEKLEQEEQEHG